MLFSLMVSGGTSSWAADVLECDLTILMFVPHAAALEKASVKQELQEKAG